jgi:hypothetical protein
LVGRSIQLDGIDNLKLQRASWAIFFLRTPPVLVFASASMQVRASTGSRLFQEYQPAILSRTKKGSFMKTLVVNKIPQNAVYRDTMCFIILVFACFGTKAVSAQSSILEKQLEQSAAKQILEPMKEAMARSQRTIDRMNDPNVGKQLGDEKLSCGEIKKQLEDSIARYETQSAKYDAAVDAKNASTEKYAQDIGGVGGQLKQLGAGLASVTAGIFGGKVAGDAVARAATDSYLQAHGQQAKEANELGKEGEKLSAESDRGQALMRLGKAKGCTGLPSGPSTPVKPTHR